MIRPRLLLLLLLSLRGSGCTLAETEANLLGDLQRPADAAGGQAADKRLDGAAIDVFSVADSPPPASELGADLPVRDLRAGDLSQDLPSKDLPSVIKDLPLVPLEGSACPSECVNACQGGVCKLDCGLGCSCPAGFICEIDCIGPASCQGPIDCRQARSCLITCNDNACLDTIQCGAACTVGCFLSSCRAISCGAESCKVTCSGDSCKGDITCGPGSCSIDCFDSSCTGAVDCSGSCACSTTCAAGACGGGLACPPGCASTLPAGCTNVPPALCNGC